MKRLASSIFLVAVIWMLPVPASAQKPNDILVIVNSSVRANSISPGELKDLFLKKRTSWGASGKVTPLHTKSSALKNDFRDAVLGMTSEEEKKYWNDRKIKTGDNTPVSFSNTLKATYKLRGAISYVYRSDYKEGVAKVVLVLSAK